MAAAACGAGVVCDCDWSCGAALQMEEGHSVWTVHPEEAWVVGVVSSKVRPRPWRGACPGSAPSPALACVRPRPRTFYSQSW